MDHDFSIKPCDTVIDFEQSSAYRKIPLSDKQRTQIRNLLPYLPEVGATNMLHQAWIVRYPKGYSVSNLMAYGKGGFGTPLMGEKGIEAHAAMYQAATQAAALGIFTALSAATGQYYLSRIDNQLLAINGKIDDVLNFLYGENRAELLAEVRFVKRIHDNYASIMMSDYQRLASITGLQNAQKIAVKDLEFYLGDLNRISNKSASSDFRHLCKAEEEAWNALRCIELALQLCVLGCILEMFLSENYDLSYVEYLKNEMISHINRCESTVLTSFSSIESRIKNYGPKPFENVEAREKEKYVKYIKNALIPYNSEQDSPIRKMLEEVLKSAKSDETYYMSNTGNVYLKKAE